MSGTITGQIPLNGTTLALGTATVKGATFVGPGTLATTGTVTVKSAGLSGGAVWDNTGTVDSTAQISGVGQFINESGAVLDLESTTQFTSAVGLSNAGTLVSSGSPDVNVEAPITNTGTIVVDSSTLTLSGGGTLSGEVQGTGTLELFGGTWTIEPGFTHSDLLATASGARITLGGTTTTLGGTVLITSTTFVGPGTLATTGTVTVKSAGLSGGAVWDNTGTVDSTAQISGVGQFINESGAVLDLESTTQFTSAVGLSNAGTLVSSGSPDVNVEAPITNTGTIVVDSSTLTLSGGGTLSGEVQGTGALELFSGTWTIELGFTHSDLLATASGARITLGGTTTTLGGTVLITSTTFVGPGTLATTGTVTVKSAGLSGGAVWDNTGTVDSTAQISGVGHFINESGAVLDLESTPQFTSAVGLSNAGTLVSSGSTDVTVEAPVVNTGTIVVDSGTLTLSGGGTLSGEAQGTGALELFGATWTIEPGFTHSGPLVLASDARITLGGTTTTLGGTVLITSATFVGPGTLATTGAVTVQSGPGLSGGAVWNNTGTVSGSGSTGNGVQLVNSGSLVNGASVNATAVISGGTYGVRFGGGTGMLTNYGTISGTTGVIVGTNVASATLTNSGTIAGSGGVAVMFAGTNDVLVTQPGGTLAGAVNVSYGANLTIPTQVYTATNFNVTAASPSITAASTITFQTMVAAPVIVTLPEASSGGGGAGGVVELGEPSSAVDSNPQVGGLDGDTDNGIEISGGGDDGAQIEGGDGGSGPDPSGSLPGADPPPGSTLVVTSGGTIVARIPLVENLVGETVHISHPTAGKTFLTVCCFAAGTRILTMSGEVAVESLCAGAMVPTMPGEKPRPVVWVGHRRIDARHHPRPLDIWPVRVRAGALGDGEPQRDILLSPDHSLFIGNNLVP